MAARRALWVLLTLVGTGWWATATAARSAEDWVLDAGAAMLRVPGLRARGGARTLVVNGARLRLVSGHSPRPLPALAADLAERCGAHGGGWLDSLGDVATDAAAPDPGVLVIERANAGLVACLDRGTDSQAAESWLQRLERFAATGDVTAFGGVRMVRLEREPGGTFFVAVWNLDALPLASMFPAERDAPGVDVKGVPRPPGSQRIFSAWQQRAQAVVAVYESPWSDARLRDYYRELGAQRVESATPAWIVGDPGRAAFVTWRPGTDSRQLVTIVGDSDATEHPRGR